MVFLKSTSLPMSYNSQGNRNPGRDRDRERPRQGSSKPSSRDRERDRGIRPPSSSFGHPDDSYRRQDQRDYFGYRGNYRKPGYQGNRKRESYDKYRPGNKNKPLRPWNDKRKPGPNDRSRDRSEYKPEDRRPSQDGKERFVLKNLGFRDRTEEASHRNSDPAPRVPPDRVETRVGSLTSDSKVNQLVKKARMPEIKDEKLLHLFDDDIKEEATQAGLALNNKKSESEGTKNDSNAKENPQSETKIPEKLVSLEKRELPERKGPLEKSNPIAKNYPLEKKSFVERQESSTQMDPVSKQTVSEKLDLFDKKSSNKDVDLQEEDKRKSEDVVGPEETNPKSDQKSQVDGSVESEMESEAETVITNDPISTEVAKLLVRKRGVDEERRRLKRKIIYSDESDEESDEGNNDDDDSYRPSSSQRPTEEQATLLDRSTTPSLTHPALSRRRSSNDSRKSANRSGSDSSDESDTEEIQERRKSKQESKPSTSYKMKRDSTGRSLLQRACKKGDLEAVKNLIARGADANESDFGGFTCLHEAALAGNTKIVEFLIKKGADVNKQALEAGDSETPLMDASENKHVETVKVLLAHGADPNITNVDGFSALTKLYHLQTEEDNYDEVISLLSTAADKEQSLKAISLSPRKVIEDPNENYFNDLTKKKSSAIYKYVAQGLKEAAAEDFILHGYSLLKKPDILILAARHGHTELVDILLGLNPGSFDINTKNKAGVSILLASVGRGNYDVVKLLLTRGADPLLTREKDSLNALQIAKHSAQHDPREVFLIEKHLSGESEKPSIQHPPSSPTPDGKNLPKSSFLKKEPTEYQGHTVEASDAKQKPKYPLENEVASKKRKNLEDGDAKGIKKRKDAVKATIEETQATGEEAKELEKALLGSPTGESKDKLAEEHRTKIHRTASNTSLSPGPTTKAQEEQKQKALEEAKIWQEKVQAKKRARKEMFLQAEKEKERKRKEDEERRVELEKQEKLKAREDEIKKAQEAEKLAKDLEAKRKKLETDLILQKYPIGLRQFIFGLSVSDVERLKYSPLYVFDVGGGSAVIDLQISLLLAKPVSDLHEQCRKKEGDVRVLDQEAKTKVWPLFFPMVGVGRNHQVEADGLAKFVGLQLSFLPYEIAAEYVRANDAGLHEKVWSVKKETRVSLALLPVASTTTAAPVHPHRGLENGVSPKAGFVPPRWKLRQDVVKTISSAHTPLW